MCPAGKYSSAEGATACGACEGGAAPLGGGGATRLICTSTGNNSICSFNNWCYDSTCTAGIIGRYIEGEVYYNNELMNVTIASPGASLITVTFTLFMVELNYDLVAVSSCRNASCVNATQAALLTGKLLPPPRNSTTGFLQLAWSSDVCCPRPSDACFCDSYANANVLAGWIAQFEVFGTTACPGAAAGPVRPAD